MTLELSDAELATAATAGRPMAYQEGERAQKMENPTLHGPLEANASDSLFWRRSWRRLAGRKGRPETTGPEVAAPRGSQIAAIEGGGRYARTTRLVCRSATPRL